MTSCRHKRAIALIFEAQAFVDGAVLYSLASARQGDSTLTQRLLQARQWPAVDTSERLLWFLKFWLLWMAQYCIRRHLPGKAIQLSEAAASCAMTSCRHKRAIDLIFEALAFVDGAQYCIHCQARRFNSHTKITSGAPMASCRHKRAIDLILEAQAFVDGAVLYPLAPARQGDSTLRGSGFVRHDQLSTQASD